MLSLEMQGPKAEINTWIGNIVKVCDIFCYSVLEY